MLCRLRFQTTQDLDTFQNALKDYMLTVDAEDEENGTVAKTPSRQKDKGQYQLKTPNTTHFSSFIIYRTCNVSLFGGVHRSTCISLQSVEMGRTPTES